MMDKTVNIIKVYMEENGLSQLRKEERMLFSNVRGEKLTRQGIACILKKYTDKCHLAEISSHWLRHYVESGKMVSNKSTLFPPVPSESLTILF